MDASATLGRLFDTTISGTASGNYTVPTGRFAIIQIGVSAGGFASLDVNSKNFSTCEVHLAVTAFATQGETMTWTFTGPGSPHYRILVFYSTTLT